MKCVLKVSNSSVQNMKNNIQNCEVNSFFVVRHVFLFELFS